MNILISNLLLFNNSLENIPDSKLLINTLNAHSYNTAQSDKLFAEIIMKSDVLLPDGISIVFALRFLNGTKLKKIAGSDLFYYEMKRLNFCGGKCFFLGSSESNLEIIKERAKHEFPNIQVFSYSPPFKKEFSVEDTAKMISAINSCKPDVLFIGMTAPKQEKWAYDNFNELDVMHICCIGAVFDFYSLRVKRAPQSFIKVGLEWFYRFIREPRRMWHRYLVGNWRFIYWVMLEKNNISRKQIYRQL
ncbi:MAG: WecB/TagA/CpsF family glycosyltransferase [Candidatus Saccharimonadaceae bacterium]